MGPTRKARSTPRELRGELVDPDRRTLWPHHQDHRRWKLLEFASVDAVRCAVAVTIPELTGVAVDSRIELRIGINPAM
jgi:hypothetical protein